MKKLLSLLLVLALLPCAAMAESEAAQLANAVSSIRLETPTLPLVEEPVTLTLMFQKASNNQTDFENMFQIEAIEQLTGIRLKWSRLSPPHGQKSCPLR